MVSLDIAAPRRRFGRIEETALTALGVAALAQHWLWGAWPGLSLALCIVALGAGALLINRDAPWRRLCMAAGLFILAAAPLLEAVSSLSIAVALALAICGALAAAGRFPASPSAAALTALALCPSVLWRLPRDLWRWTRAGRRGGGPCVSDVAPGVLRIWALPLLFAGVFLLLFAEANPVIEAALFEFDWLGWIDGDQLGRALFTALLIPAIWPFLRPMRGGAARVAKTKPAREFTFMGAASILRALILFNTLFAVQSGLDLALLWGGGGLPEGMTYAEYAHRGAYPLIATALLAAAFVLVALRPGTAAARSRSIRMLVYVWIGQNVLLVVSSIYRLDIYVDAYGLTYLRVAAFVWMGLVAAGLALIVARIALAKSGEWLIGANLAVLGAALYACCFVNVTAMIADHNVRGGASRDLAYLTRLGAHAIPAVDHVLDAGGVGADDRMWLRAWRKDSRNIHLRQNSDWRSWTRRDAALSTYLDARPEAPHTQLEEAPI